jgi:hypothetical protein
MLMPEIVYPICCGIDVHKSFVVACIATTDSNLVTTSKLRRFSTFTNDLRRRTLPPVGQASGSA